MANCYNNHVANKKPRPVLNGEKAPIVLILIGGLIILLGAFLIWKQFIYGTPESTFWGMVNSSLQTSGVTKHVKQEDVTGSADEYLQLELGANNVARDWMVLTQGSKDNSSKVITETVGTPTTNYVSYQQIQTPQKRQDGSAIDFSSVTGQWGKDDFGDNAGGQSIFGQAVYGAVPFGRLTSSQRQELITYMKDNDVYDVDFTTVKRVVQNGREAYSYDMNVHTDAYVGMLKKFDQMMGLNQLGQLDPSQYKGSQPIEVTMVVGIDSRELLQLTYKQADRKEDYSGYGARANIQVPEQTISRQELEGKLSQILYQ